MKLSKHTILKFLGIAPNELKLIGEGMLYGIILIPIWIFIVLALAPLN